MTSPSLKKALLVHKQNAFRNSHHQSLIIFNQFPQNIAISNEFRIVLNLHIYIYLPPAAMRGGGDSEAGDGTSVVDCTATAAADVLERDLESELSRISSTTCTNHPTVEFDNMYREGNKVRYVHSYETLFFLLLLN